MQGRTDYRWQVTNMPIGAASGLAYVAAARIATNGFPPWDSSVFLAINQLDDRLQYPLWVPMQLGALGAPLAIGAVYALRGDRRTAVRVAGAGFGAWLAAKAGKASVERGRPAAHEPSVQLRIGAADQGLGFPSGHAAVAATLAWTVGSTRRRDARAGIAALALVVGLSRVYVGAHYPLDVAGGWMLGLAVAGVTDRIVDILDG